MNIMIHPGKDCLKLNEKSDRNRENRQQTPKLGALHDSKVQSHPCSSK